LTTAVALAKFSNPFKKTSSSGEIIPKM